MSRVLHVVRGSLPESVVGPEDVVVYTAGADVPPGIAARLWDPDQERPDALTSDEVCELVFACERVIVW